MSRINENTVKAEGQISSGELITVKESSEAKDYVHVAVDIAL